MGSCATQPTDPDEDEDEYSLSISATRRQTVVDEVRNNGGAGSATNTEQKIDPDDNNNQTDKPSSSQKKKTNSKYPWVLQEHDVKDVYQFFDIEKELGRGASCRVLKVKEKESGKLFAMKEMRRDDKWNPMLFEQEVNILGKLSGHSNILHYEDCWMDNKNFYVLTSLCTGGELFGMLHIIISIYISIVRIFATCIYMIYI